MALVVEDGTGKSDAESYVSVADAGTYHTNRGTNSTAWDAANDATKEKALRLATQYLDTRWKHQWAATRWSDDQALDWPRIGLEIDGLSYDSDEIPPQLPNACAELALKVIDGDTIFADMAVDGLVESSTVRVGPITESVKYVGGSQGLKRYRLVEQLIRPLLDISNEIERA